VPENAKWFLVAKEGGYIIYNKDASYNGTPVCIEYFSSVFSGWTFSTKNDLAIYLFNFYELADGVKVYHDVVQNPTVKFECEDSRYVEQDYALAFTLDDLAPEITDIAISFEAGSQTVPVTEYESSEDGKAYNCVIPASQIDVEEGMESFTIKVVVNNSYEIEYEGLKTVTIVDEPFFENLKPAPNAQTMDDKRPLISAKIGNVGENPTFTMTLTIGEGDDKQTVTVDPVYGVDTLVYTPLEDMADGRVTVHILVERADGVTAEKSWSFTVGKAGYQLYFGQLHSHTTYSDGSGSLETALDYVASLPESANVDFVAFTDHSNYFDTTSAANPADSLNDKSLMTEASLALWNKYKSTVASFNASHTDLLAIAGFEMTWSGGPGHINTFDSDGLVSRNNASLNNKTNDAGMKLYYETINKGESLNQFNHPGNTFGNFTDFSYWDETTDDHMFLVEVGNGEGQIGAGGYYPSYEQYILALDQGWHLAPTNNQDNHKGRWGNANDARDVVLTNDFSEQGIYDAIRALRVYATEDKNLQVTYVVNDQPMGTIFGEDEKPAELKVEVTVYEPDEKESIQKVEIVADGGKVVQTWDSAAELAEGYVTATLTPDQTYYFARVTEADGDLAVTAPVWVGSGVSAGITEVKSSVDPAIVNEATTLTTTFFSNEETNGTIKSIVYTVDGSKVVGTDTTGYTLTKDGLDVTFSYTPDVAKRVTITVTAVIEFNGKEKTYTKDLILSVRETGGELPVTPIATVMKQTEEGFEYAIEGVVTSNASGYDKDTAFFDCIYVQDETGGICCFPVSGEYKIGDKVHIEGYTDWYQGEPELQVTKIDVIGSGEVEPTVVTSAQINDLSVLGSLVTLKGTIENFEEVNGLIQTIMVKDENGDVARVFIDGYITTGAEVVGCVVGAAIEATGLSSYDDTWPDTNYFARIRIRNRADIICGSAKADVARVYGNTRYKTSIAVAQELKERLGVEKFDTILICTGENPVDALAGSYLSVKMMAPILMVQNKKTPIKLVTDYVRDNLAEGGKVYVFGGENAVPDACLEGIRELGIEPERLAGSTRFRTNMLINETIGIEEGAEVLICDGQGEKDENGVEQYAFADSLSASASGRPLFLVDGSASAPKNYQKEYLKELAEKGCTFVILGGEKAVSPEMKASIEEIVGKEVERIAGSTRYRTSAALAERFFPDAKGIVLATGVNFPDGLAGGALAAALGAPIFLCSESKAAVNLAKDFVEAHQITTGVVLGGPAEGKDLITDANACLIFGLESAEEIHVRFLE
ncbi:MAG: cell wall-binding repeat-containing protein, partial [Lachnospiraceae bacterium]|nr:cell wall-binding repeat-containing protein [Lachnospiraceae bacterium]